MTMTAQSYPLWLAEQDADGDIIAGLVVGWMTRPDLHKGTTIATPVVAYVDVHGRVYETRGAHGHEPPTIQVGGTWRDVMTAHAQTLTEQSESRESWPGASP